MTGAKLQLLRGDAMPQRLEVALAEFDRVAPAHAAVVREEFGRLRTAVADLEAGRIDVHVTRLQSKAIVDLSGVASDVVVATRYAESTSQRMTAASERLANLAERMVDEEDRAADGIRQQHAHAHAQRIAELEAQVAHAKSRERVVIATVGAIASAVSAAIALAASYLAGGG